MTTYSNYFGTNEGEGGVTQDGPPAQETTRCTSDTMVLNERLRILLVPETKSIVVRASTEIKYDPEDDQPSDGNDLDRTNRMSDVTNVDLRPYHDVR